MPESKAEAIQYLPGRAIHGTKGFQEIWGWVIVDKIDGCLYVAYQETQQLNIQGKQRHFQRRNTAVEGKLSLASKKELTLMLTK